MARDLNSRIAAILLLLGLCSCGPIYETRHSFTPPKSAEGRNCTFQCQTVKMQCQQIEEMQEQRCNENARWQQRRCQQDLENRGKKERWYDCGLETCTADSERCEETYRSCYQSCGGRVDSTSVCTYNCEKAAPGPKN